MRRVLLEGVGVPSTIQVNISSILLVKADHVPIPYFARVLEEFPLKGAFLEVICGAACKSVSPLEISDFFAVNKLCLHMNKLDLDVLFHFFQ